MRFGLAIGLGLATTDAGAPSDVTAPTLSSAVIAADGLTLTLTYNEALDTGSTPANGDFALGGASLSAVSGVNVTGSTVVLTIAPAIFGGDTITVSYTPGTNKIRDLAANNAAALSSQATTNNSTVTTPKNIMGTDCVEWWRADIGNTIAADGNWVGQKAGTTFAQGTAGARPTQNATGGPNSTAAMTFDGTDDYLQCSLVRAAPGTTPAVIWVVMKQVTWTLNDTIVNDASATFAILQRVASPGLGISAGTPAHQNNGLAVSGTPWGRVQATFTNSAADELLCIATATTGASGNTAGTAPRIGANGGLTIFGNFAIAEIAFFKAKPSAGQKTSLDAYVTARYGSGLV